MGYLVLGRRINERILIDGKIEILVVDASHGRVELAIKAPPEVKISRLPSHAQEEKKKGGFHEHKNRNNS